MASMLLSVKCLLEKLVLGKENTVYLFTKGKQSNELPFQRVSGKLYYMLNKEGTFANKEFQNSHYFRAKTKQVP